MPNLALNLILVSMMSNNGAELFEALIDNLRAARGRSSVIKMRFVTLKGASGDRPILAFEGDDDKIVYGRWIARINHLLRYEVFVCNGKRGVAELKSMLDRDLGSLNEAVYYFVDRDFNDLDEFDALIDDTVYMTPSYSFENYLVSAHVLDAVLRDDFPLHGCPHIRQRLLNLFDELYRGFLYLTGEFNWRLFIARKNSIPLLAKPPARLASYATVELRSVSVGTGTANEQVQLSRPPTVGEEQLLIGAFPRASSAHTLSR